MSHCHTLIETLRQRNYRITPQREMIIQAVAHSEQHMTAEDVLIKLRQHTQAINLATVYRTLEMLWEEGLACRNDLGEGKIVFSVRKHGPHIHLVCRQCNHVIEADYALLNALETRLQTEYNFTADLQHLSIFGVCENCL
ncbi:MAG: transcriptional repressor [Anaerolineales bacterium]|nr:transcriptional repressor [Anaerolineales bacterium]